MNLIDVINAQIKDVKEISGKSYILIDSSELYPGGGGQPPDRGYFEALGIRIELKGTEKINDLIYWLIEPSQHNEIQGISSKIEIGKNYKIFIDSLWRFELSQQHTAQHIMSGLAFSLFGWETEGFSIFTENSKVEFIGADEDKEKYEMLERKTNEVILSRIPVKTYEEDSENVIDQLRKNTNKERLRIVEIPQIDKCPCGGTHVENTVEVGGFAILNWERKNSKAVRVIFASGVRLAKISKFFYGRELELRKKLTGDVNIRIDEILAENNMHFKKEKKLIELLAENILKRSINEDTLELKGLPLTQKELKFLDSLLREREVSGTLFITNEEGYFVLSGPKAEEIFLNLKTNGASGGGKGIITGKLGV